jgi:hypothetical protein
MIYWNLKTEGLDTRSKLCGFAWNVNHPILADIAQTVNGACVRQKTILSLAKSCWVSMDIPKVTFFYPKTLLCADNTSLSQRLYKSLFNFEWDGTLRLGHAIESWNLRVIIGLSVVDAHGDNVTSYAACSWLVSNKRKYSTWGDMSRMMASRTSSFIPSLSPSQIVDERFSLSQQPLHYLSLFV